MFVKRLTVGALLAVSSLISVGCAPDNDQYAISGSTATPAQTGQARAEVNSAPSSEAAHQAFGQQNASNYSSN